MASIFGHAIVGFTLSKVIDSKKTKWLLLAAIFSTILPDFDVLAFNFRIPYEHTFGHRGFTHSILFALTWALFLTFTVGRKQKIIWFVVIFLSTSSHGILDALTTGGKGVGFFIPFDNARYFFSFRPIKVSPIGFSRFFSSWGLQVLLSEFKYVFLPCFFIFTVRILIKPNNS